MEISSIAFHRSEKSKDLQRDSSGTQDFFLVPYLGQDMHHLSLLDKKNVSSFLVNLNKITFKDWEEPLIHFKLGGFH